MFNECLTLDNFVYGKERSKGLRSICDQLRLRARDDMCDSHLPMCESNFLPSESSFDFLFIPFALERLARSSFCVFGGILMRGSFVPRV